MLTKYRTQTPFTHPLNDLMSSFLGRDISQPLGHDDVQLSTPKVNITETKEGFGLERNVPGFTKDQIRITMEENILKIHGEQEKVEAQEGESYLRREFSHTSFERGFHLPENVNGDGIKAEVTHGVLRIHLPKVEPSKPATRQIKIN